MPATETPRPRSAPQITSEEQAAIIAEQNKMRDHFAAQKKVTIRTREDERVQVNDYTFIIKGGERVEVPEQIADILEESGRI